jgi:hypothetical protein
MMDNAVVGARRGAAGLRLEDFRPQGLAEHDLAAGQLVLARARGGGVVACLVAPGPS